MLEWDHQQLDPGSWPFAFDGSPPVFFVADEPDAGEATFVQSGSSGAVTLGEVVELRNDATEPAIVLAAAVGALIP